MMLSPQLVQSRETPPSLTTLCCNFIVENINVISREKGLLLPTQLWEDLIKYYQQAGYEVDDKFLLLFHNRVRRLRLRNSQVTNEGLSKVLRLSHHLTELDLSNCPELSEDLIPVINECGENLHTLVLGPSARILGNKHLCFHSTVEDALLMIDKDDCNVCARGYYILKLPKLRSLSIHNVISRHPKFDFLLAPMENLTHLNLSNCGSLGSFKFLNYLPNLLSLGLYNAESLRKYWPALCQLKKLRHLDISQSPQIERNFSNEDETLAEIVESLPNLVSLDISGTNLAGRGVAEYSNNKSDIIGLRSRINKPLEFLGLYMTASAACSREDIPALVISGDKNEEQLIRSAYVFMDRPDMLQAVLKDLFHIFRQQKFVYVEHNLNLVLEMMERYIYDKEIQITGSATIFHLIKHKVNLFGQHLKRRIVRCLLNAMDKHCNDHVMTLNGCLILCQFNHWNGGLNGQVLLGDFERLIRLLMLIALENTGVLQRVSVFLLNHFACLVDRKERELMGDFGVIQKMLQLIMSRVEGTLCDEILDVAWSTMWNVTDEMPCNCKIFLDLRGMDVFMDCHEKFPHREELLRNMLGLLGNVAEVKSLRPHLMNSKFISVFTVLLKSYQNGIDVSYNAAGVLSHIASDGEEAWTIDYPKRRDVLDRMVSAIAHWDINAERNINYRSFKPILGLLNHMDTPGCQHWAAWALANLTKLYPEKYCKLVEAEDGLILLQAVINDSRPYMRIKELANMVIFNCYQHRKKIDPVELDG